MGMNHLDDIVEAVKEKGLSEVHWNSLIGIYFKGGDEFKQIQTWAVSQGLVVMFNTKHQTCTFRATYTPAR